MALLSGIDIVEVERIRKAFNRWGQTFRERIYTEKEIDYSEKKKMTKYQSYSARFAAKEALAKALGTGIAEGLNFKDIEVLNGSRGGPYIVLQGKAREIYANLNGKNISVSLSHCKDYAVASVIIETSDF